MKIMVAPEISSLEEVEKHKYIKEFIYSTSRANLSENAGDIEMNLSKYLCDNCKKKNQYGGENGE